MLAVILLGLAPLPSCMAQEAEDAPTDPSTKRAVATAGTPMDLMSTGVNVVVQLQNPEGTAVPAKPISDAEQIADLRRAIDTADARLKEIAGKIDDPKGEYAQSEEEFQALDQKLNELRKRIKDAGAEGSARIAEEITATQTTWKLAKDRFDLAIEERKALQEQVKTIEQKRVQDQAALDRLTGAAAPAEVASGTPADAGAAAPAPVATGPPTGATAPSETPAASAPAPGASASAEPATAPPADTTTPAPASAPTSPAAMIPGSPAAILAGSSAETPAASADAPAAKAVKPPSEELIKARQDVEQKGEVAREAKEEVKSASERLAVLDRSIALEKKLLETDRKKADNAEQTRTALSQELEQKSISGAPEAERREVAKKVREAEARASEARREARGHADRLDEFQSERAQLLALQVEAGKAATKAEREVEQAEKKVAQLENPFAPMNLLRWVVDHGPRLIAILLAMVLLHYVSRLFTRRVVKIMAQSGIRGSREEREARANTLVGVFHNAVSVAVCIGGILMILQEVGIPIAPLLGGAAIFGLAVAFGAQNLIRDYFYGFVILLENQYKLNDVVRIGDHSGQVERITLRMTVLRDLEGNVHFMPNGEITSVTNMTHGWSRALFDLGVAYKEDVDRVIGVIQDLGRELRSDPAWRLLILEDLEMLGVDSFGDSAVVIRFLIKTRTLKQWAVKREMMRRIKNKFDELGIEIPFPHRTIYHRVEGEGQSPAEEMSRMLLHRHHGPGV